MPTAGVRDWLTRRLAVDLGVAANIEMPFPGRFFADAIGLDDADDPWSVERLTWAVLDVLEAGVVDVPGWTAASGDGPVSRRFAVARRIADLFDRYATTRPEILQQWQRGVRGDGTVRATAVGGVSAPGDEHTVGGLPASMEWQYDLWRHVRERIGSPSRAELLAERIGQLRRGELRSALPASVELFGVSALSRTQLDVLSALSTVGDVHVSLLHPSAIAWLRVAPIELGHPVVRSRHGDPEALGADSHPLLRSWGRQSSETAAMVRGLPPPVTVVATDEPTPARPVTLLEHLRADLTADHPPTPFVPRADDTSIQVHACHGTIRQLEVLRDVLGHLFVADPSLRPDDVLVICPDLDRFEPFAAAVLGRGALARTRHGERPVPRYREPDRRRPGDDRPHRRRPLHGERRARRRRPRRGAPADGARRRRSRPLHPVERSPRNDLGTRRGPPANVARHRHRPRHVGAGIAVAARRDGHAGADPAHGLRWHRALRRRRRRRRRRSRTPRRARVPAAPHPPPDDAAADDHRVV